MEGQFVNEYSDWSSPAWDEQDWSKVHELSIREVLVERKKAGDAFGRAECLSCPNFMMHFGMQHDEWLIKENIQALKMLMSDQNLSLLPDYQQRTEVLKDLKFIDEESRVLLKGKVACEVHSADELVLTELILENVLASYVLPRQITNLKPLTSTADSSRKKSSPSFPASSSKKKPTPNPNSARISSAAKKQSSRSPKKSTAFKYSTKSSSLPTMRMISSHDRGSGSLRWCMNGREVCHSIASPI